MTDEQLYEERVRLRAAAGSFRERAEKAEERCKFLDWLAEYSPGTLKRWQETYEREEAKAAEEVR